MLLATRCPHCETVFRLQEAQLALRGGLVRCGHCQSVFNAREHLVDAPGATPPVVAGAPAESNGTDHEAATAAPAPDDASTQAPNEPARPAPDFRSEGWDMWAPAADARIDPALRHDVATVMRPTLAPTGSEQPHADHDPTQVAEPESDPADHVTAEHALHDAALASVESGDVREPSFTAWPASGMQVEPEQPSPAVATDPDEPTLPDAASSSWEADLEPRFGASEPEASTGMPGTGTSEPFDAVSAADRPQTMEPFATTADGERFAVVREERAREPSRIVWRVVGVFAALVLAVLLIAQLAWWQRETVMVYWPGSQPMFARVCEQLGCQISPPRDIDGLQVEPSDLRQVDGPHRLELRVPLRNRYNVALAYPAMELTLLDDKNNIAIRRVLWPQDYVRAGTPIAAGLPAGATQTMIVRLDTGTAVASNFRVQIFYP